MGPKMWQTGVVEQQQMDVMSLKLDRIYWAQTLWVGGRNLARDQNDEGPRSEEVGLYSTRP